MKPAVIIPWRAGETELQTTIDSAVRSIGNGLVLPVEDKVGDGPAMTRHRGIEAATDADVIVIVDAHMTFDGSVLRDMARQVAQRGGLLCAKCYHNPECSYDGNKPYYAGADIHWTGQDQNGKQALVWKWSADPNPGKRPCVGGACYVFRRAWYYETGQCLSALPSWGCDEEALSITAWLSGHWPRVFDGKVAHRWRSSPPWKSGARAITTSRAALICAVAADVADRDTLLRWQGVKAVENAAIARWRDALKKQPKTWAQWKAEVPTMPKQEIKQAEPIKTPERKKYTPNLVASMAAVVCPHCHEQHDPRKLPVTHTYPNSRRHVCPSCARPFVSMVTRR